LNRFAALFVVLLLAGATGAEAACLSPGEARQAVASGQARSLGSLKGSVGGEIVKAQLCKEGGRYVYRLSVLANGKVSSKVINASR